MIQDRKLEHIKICLDKDVNATHNYWDDVVLKHVTIPKKDLDEISTEIEFLGKKLTAPILIDAMTGGHPVAKKINENIAKVAEELGIAIAVGSQRSAIENSNLEDTYGIVAQYDVPLRIGNLGAPQFALGYGEKEVHSAIEMIDAHALEIHFNYLQESVQPEGDRVVKGLIDNLSSLAKKYKLIGKETGAGFDYNSAKLLKELGFVAIDVSGVSGTSFAAVEYYRRGKHGKLFWDWGLPSPYCVLNLKSLGLPLIGSGGLRSGLDLARAIALGADVGGFARSLLKYATKSWQELLSKVQELIEELKIAMFLTGASYISELKQASYVIKGELRFWL